MQKLHFLAAMAVILGTTACPSVDPDDGFDSILTTADLDDEADESTDDNGESGTDDATTTTDDATTEASTTVDETTADTTDGGCGSLGCDCVDSSTCDAPLECTAGTCQLPGAEEETTADTTDTDGGDPWDPAACMEPSQILMVGELPGNFCSTPCVMDTDCPASPAGTQAACALTTMAGADPSFCALICQPAMDSCPAGSTCKDLMDPMNPGLGLCTYP